MQVSRLGKPLSTRSSSRSGRRTSGTATEPEDDAQFAGSYLSPELAGLIKSSTEPRRRLDGAIPTTRRARRPGAVLLTGVPGLNFTGDTDGGSAPAEHELARRPAPPAGWVDRARRARRVTSAGFPNGRRLGDDIIDIELRAVAQGYGPFLHGRSGCRTSPNNVVGDGVDANDKPFSSSFPYVAAPRQGYEVP